MTLKEGVGNKRIERKLVKVSGSGTADVTFAVPQGLSGKTVIVAAFIGEEFTRNLQHLNSSPVSVR